MSAFSNLRRRELIVKGLPQFVGRRDGLISIQHSGLADGPKVAMHRNFVHLLTPDEADRLADQLREQARAIRELDAGGPTG